MSGRRLIAAAALFHVAAAVLLFAVGRSGIAPHAVDGNGIVYAWTSDSLLYQSDAERLVLALRRGGPAAWRESAAPLHVRPLSLAFALFAPSFGYSTLAAEPLNVLYYLAIVGLTFAIGREAGGKRAGIIAAAIVALWPTLVFHTAQFFKDPLFIACALALVLVVVTWLTTRYDWRRAVIAGLVLAGASGLLLLIRPQFTLFIVVFLAFGLALLVVRQWIEKRALVWNLSCAVAALAASLLMLAQSARTHEKFKAYQPPYRGESKSLAGGRVRVPTAIAWRPSNDGAPLLRAADEASVALGSVRDRYILSDRVSGSGIDGAVEYRNARQLVAYLPRAAAIGLWAPFPPMWAQPGRVAGRAGRAVAGVETAAIYLLELLAIASVVLGPRRLAPLLLLLIASFGVTILAAVVTNIGTLYRFRYSFWILLAIAGVTGGEKLVRVWRGIEARRRAATAVLACLGAIVCSCGRPARGELAITNLTGQKIDALFLSPSDAPTWEENVLGRDVLRDGHTVAIRFDPRAKSGRWDLRADSGVHRAEWMRLDRSRISAITLRVGKNAAVAEIAGRR